MRRSKYTSIYADVSNGEWFYYVRLTPLETPRFSHGIAFSGHFIEKKEAENFADQIDDYIQSFVDCEIFRSKSNIK